MNLFILKSEKGTLTNYESVTRHLSRDFVENSDMALREIVQFIGECVSLPIGMHIFFNELCQFI